VIVEEPTAMTSPTATAPAAAALDTVRLTERALLAALNISEWGARRRDREVTARVAREHGAHRDAGRYTKRLVPRPYLAAIDQVRGEARAAHYKLTLPWCSDGFRILPVDLHLAYMERCGDLRARFHDAVAAFLATYGEAKAAARSTLGSLYREADYPPPARLRAAFAFDINLQPLPGANDWHIQLPQAAVTAIRRDLEARLADARRLALADLHRRLATAVSRMATTLADSERVFRNSLVGNLRDLCHLLPALNVAADPGLAALASDVEQRLATLDPALLRRDPVCRQSAAIDAAALVQTITDRLASYTGTAA
jgi:hypothetical protein